MRNGPVRLIPDEPESGSGGLRAGGAFLRGKAKGPSAQTLAASVLVQAFIVVSGVVAARALGVEGRGQLALLWLLPVTLTLLGGLGIPQATTFYVAREADRARGVVRISIRIVAFLAFALCATYALGLIIFGTPNSVSATDALLSVSLVPLLLAQNLATATLLGLKRYRAFNGGRIAPVLLYALGATALFAADQATLTSILAVMVASWAAAAAGTWAVVRRDLPGEDGRPEVGRPEILKFGLRGVIGTVSPIDDVRIDQLFVGFLLDARALGLYVAAVAFCNLPRFVAHSIGSVNYPRIASARDSDEAWAFAARTARIGLLSIAGTVAILIVVMPTLLPLLFGQDFEDAVEIGYVLLAAAYFVSAHRLLTEIARGLGHPGYGSITELVNIAVFLLGLLVFAAPPSAVGVATAVLAGGISSTLVLSSLLVRLRRKQLGGKGDTQ